MGFMGSDAMSDYEKIGEVEDWTVYRRQTTP
jgi:hypothetical protein